MDYESVCSDGWLQLDRPGGVAEVLGVECGQFVYDPETGQATATRMNRGNVAAMKVFADMYSKAVRDAVVLSGMRPGTLDKRLSPVDYDEAPGPAAAEV
jgi:hypothetical protein